MSIYEHAQTSLAGGEISPRLRGHFDSDLYKRSVGLLRNFQPTTHGSGLLRQGTRRVGPLPGADLVRNIQYRSSLGADVTVILGDHVVTAYTEGGAQGVGGEILFGATEYVVNGDFGKGSTGWAPFAAAVILGGAARCGAWSYIPGHGRDGDTPPVAAKSQFTSGGWSQAFDLTAGTYTLTFSVPAIDGRGPLIVRVGTSAGASDLLADTPLLATGGPHHFLVDAPGGRAYLEFLAPDRAIAEDGGALGLAGAPGASVSAVSFVGAGGTAASAATPWSLDMLDDIQYATEPAGSGDRMFFAHPNTPTQVLTHAADGSWLFGAAAFVNKPADWATTNWPACVEIHGGRLWLAATPEAKNAVWGSRSGNLLDFSRYTTAAGEPTPEAPTEANGNLVTADCSIVERAATKGAIQWIRGQRALFLGCDDGEVAVTAQAGVIAPNDIQFREESAFGAAPVQAVPAGSQVLYVTRDRRRVQMMRFAQETAGQESEDISFPFEHLTKVGVLELHWAREPVPTVIAMLADGTIAACTFDAGKQMAAGWRIDLGAPTNIIRSCNVANGPLGSTLWLSVQRPTGLSLETLALYEPPVADRSHLDGHVSLPIPANGILTGLSHLVGQTVNAVMGTVVVPGLVVSEAGTVTLPEDSFTPGAAAVVGLPFPSAKIKTLPPEGGNPRGTSQRAKRRWVRLVLRLNESALPLVNGVRPPERTPSTPMDTGEPLVTGDVLMDVDAAWEDQGQLTIEQDLPLRTEILAWFGSVALSEG